MIELGIDIETYSETPITAGVHKYAADPSFDILLFAYSFNGEPEKIIDLALGQKIPPEVLDHLTSMFIKKTAHNAAFEFTCLSIYLKKHYGITLSLSQWSCTMVWAGQTGLPFALDMVAKVLHTEAQKDKIGKELIKYFTMPCMPTKKNGMQTRNLPGRPKIDNFTPLYAKKENAIKAFDAYYDLLLMKWGQFKKYCKNDVVTEQAIRKRVQWFAISDFEKPIWKLDQKINNRGIAVDLKLINNAIKINAIVSAELTEELTSLSSIVNPKSIPQVKKFLEDSLPGLEISSLNKDSIADLKKQIQNKGNVEQVDLCFKVLSIREQLTRTSIKKYFTMLEAVGADGRIRGLFFYYGANRTGRWAGRGVQFHNLAKGTLDKKSLALARQLVLNGNLKMLKLCFDDISAVISNLIRPAFVPSNGNDLIVSDLSAIEARITAWLAGEQWRLDLFKAGGKIYEASASLMFNIALELITKDSMYRQKGKMAELALGYQGGPDAITRIELSNKTPIKDRIPEDEKPALVKLWRRSNPKIVRLWYLLQDTAIAAIKQGQASFKYGISFYMNGKNMIIKLPSGRELVYLDTSYDIDGGISYWGMDQVKKIWCKQYTYGGKLLENIVQAIARDVLTSAMVNIDKAGHDIVLHVHDEIGVEGKAAIKDEINEMMAAPIAWAPGLPLGAETFVAKFYQK